MKRPPRPEPAVPARPAGSPSLARLQDGAVVAAQAAGNHAWVHGVRRTEVVRTFAHDVKLKLDQECQTVAERVIRSRFPTHHILGEESAAERAPTPDAGAYEWVIDPIDGTVNFSHGLPFWCRSVAVRQGATVLAGAVYAPVLKELYTAVRGGPALCNGEPIHVSATRRLSAALVMTGLDKAPDPRLPSLAVFRALANAVQKTRVMGSAALDICRVASGQADGYFETGIYVWDISAAGLIVERAGGRTEILREFGGHRLAFLASNGALHTALRRAIAAPAGPGSRGA